MRPIVKSVLSIKEIAHLCEHEWVVVSRQQQNLELIEALRRDAQELRGEGRFVSSQVGSRSYQASELRTSRRLDEETRRSETGWLRPPIPPALGNVTARRELDDLIESLRKDLSSFTGEPLEFSIELAYGTYPIGGFYTEHLDVPQTNNGHFVRGRSETFLEKREFSFLLYLNEADWNPETDGGQLRIFLDHNQTNTNNVLIPPLGGTMVVFRSDTIRHEVLKAQRQRWSVIGWFRSRNYPGFTEDRFAAVVRSAQALERAGFDKAAARLFLRLATASSDQYAAAYAFCRQGHALWDGRDDRSGAAEAFRQALHLDPESAVAASGLALATGDFSKIQDTRLRAAATRDPALIMEQPSYIRTVFNEFSQHNLVDGGTFALLRTAVKHASLSSPCAILEFGVFRGRSLRMLMELAPEKETRFHAFDSFQGLPEQWTIGEPVGAYTTNGALPSGLPRPCTFHVGWFNETLPFYNDTSRIALIHLDCDLYSSTKFVFDHLGPQLQSGTVLVFDDYLAHPTWQQDQARAFHEALSFYGWSYKVLAASITTQQLVVQINN